MIVCSFHSFPHPCLLLLYTSLFFYAGNSGTLPMFPAPPPTCMFVHYYHTLCMLQAMAILHIFHHSNTLSTFPADNPATSTMMFPPPPTTGMLTLCMFIVCVFIQIHVCVFIHINILCIPYSVYTVGHVNMLLICP